MTCEGLRLSVWVCIKSFGSWPFLRPDSSCLHPLMACLFRLQPPEETCKAYHSSPSLNNGHCVYNEATNKSEVSTRVRCRCGSRRSVASITLVRLRYRLRLPARLVSASDAPEWIHLRSGGDEDVCKNLSEAQSFAVATRLPIERKRGGSILWHTAVAVLC